jgi:hypothetical protein
LFHHIVVEGAFLDVTIAPKTLTAAMPVPG